MRFFSLFLFLFFLVSTRSFAQSYELIRKLSQPTFSFKDSVNFDVKTKLEGDSLVILIRKQALETKYEFYIFNLAEEKIRKINFRGKHALDIKDFLVYKDDLFLLDISGKKILRYDIQKGRYKPALKLRDSLEASKIALIKDRLLAYQVYNYHPLDGVAKLQLCLFSLRTSQIVKERQVEFPAIAFTNAINMWVRVFQDRIFVVNPLTANVDVYNAEGDMENSFQLKLQDLGSQKHRALLNYVDSLNQLAHKQILDSNFSSGNSASLSNPEFFFSKGGIVKRIDTLRQYSYIEKLIPYNDDTIMVTIRKPGYANEFRDVCLFEINSGKIVSKTRQWRCSPSKDGYLAAPTEYFVPDIINSYLYEPFFYRNKVYAGSYYPIELFSPGKKKDTDMALFHWQQKKMKQWDLLEYEWKP